MDDTVYIGDVPFAIGQGFLNGVDCIIYPGKVVNGTKVACIVWVHPGWYT